MFPNAKGSELVAVAAVIDPASLGTGNTDSIWVPMAKLANLLAVVQTGVLGTSATLDAKLRQATTSAGAGAKDITGKAITQIVKATGDNKQALINVRADELDREGGFAFVGLRLSVGTAASIASAQLLGVNPMMGPAAGLNGATVVQVAG